MGAVNSYTIPLLKSLEIDEKTIGGKASKLAKLAQAGFSVSDGFCISTNAYHKFVKSNKIDDKIKVELGRKPFDSMRWEEIWDSALRIRSMFQSMEIPVDVADQIKKAHKTLGLQKILAVRSSAPKEDSSHASFAGLHESYIGIVGEKKLLDSVKLVWASLWSDAALLYQQQLDLDPTNSSMAVLVQEMIEEDVSGVAFGIDPRQPKSDSVIIEAVPGLCRDLVDGILDPDRWVLKKSSGELIEKKAGKRDEINTDSTLLNFVDLKLIYNALQGIEELFGWYPDIEWTGKENAFTLLQARPITTSESKDSDEKSYYLTLRPNQHKLKTLAQKVVYKLIPQLEQEGKDLAKIDLSKISDKQLADEIESRNDLVKKWKKIYWDDFIPFAHGVRHLATYYNDAVQPDDPYEFVQILKNQPMISTKRNHQMVQLAQYLKSNSNLIEKIQSIIGKTTENSNFWQVLNQLPRQDLSGEHFLLKFQQFLDDFMDVSYKNERLKNKPMEVLKNILELAKSPFVVEYDKDDTNKIKSLEKKLYDAVGEKRHGEAREVLEIGRLSWRLRDDDNLLLGRVESQFFRAVKEGIDRFESTGRLESEAPVNEKNAETICYALRQTNKNMVVLAKEDISSVAKIKPSANIKPRQLIGQPAAPGMISGQARIIKSNHDLGEFKSGEILVCDAIQPNMTHLVPLASGIVERRGGMLIHGAIIAREMGIPCVNGVPDAADILVNGDLITVDGHLGIVTIGAAEFDMELNFNKN